MGSLARTAAHLQEDRAGPQVANWASAPKGLAGRIGWALWFRVKTKGARHLVGQVLDAVFPSAAVDEAVVKACAQAAT